MAAQFWQHFGREMRLLPRNTHKINDHLLLLLPPPPPLLPPSLPAQHDQLKHNKISRRLDFVAASRWLIISKNKEEHQPVWLTCGILPGICPAWSNLLSLSTSSKLVALEIASLIARISSWLGPCALAASATEVFAFLWISLWISLPFRLLKRDSASLRS